MKNLLFIICITIFSGILVYEITTFFNLNINKAIVSSVIGGIIGSQYNRFKKNE